MHPSSYDNMVRCKTWYGPASGQRVVDLRSGSANGAYRELFFDCADYIGLDTQAGPGVDVVLNDPYAFPLEDNSVDLVISGQMLEHRPQFWRVFTEVARILKPSGLLFMIAPSAGPLHRYPVDCYRFYPDAYQALAEWSGLRVVDCWLDGRGPWRDLVGVFQKGGNLKKISGPVTPPQPPLRFAGARDPAAEVTRGERSYLNALGDLHRIVQPKLYLEIGVRKGESLALATCDAIAIDPYPEVQALRLGVHLFRCTSDDFFFFHAQEAIRAPIDLAFIDGAHLSEFVYRDFMNLEPLMAPNGVIVLDDVYPNHPAQAERERRSGIWCGDVWRFAEVLAEKRPDLKLTWLDTAPTGLLVVTRLKPSHRALIDYYNPTVRQMLAKTYAPPPEKILQRTAAVIPTEAALRAATAPQGAKRGETGARRHQV